MTSTRTKGWTTLMLVLAALLLPAGVLVAGGQSDSGSQAAATGSTGTAMKAATGASSIPGTGLVTAGVAEEAKKLNGAGATFPAVLYTKWFSEYATLTGVQINYQAIGSGGGIKSISDKTVDFGASDGPMTDEQLAAASGGYLLHIPAAMGGVVPTYNIPEISGQAGLKFTPDTLAGIYLGEIKTWNDAKLVADNPGLKDVAKDIVVVHRSDGSGTTNIWTSYLSAVSTKWSNTVGAANSVEWPVGLGGKGNEGVAGVVKQTPYSLGYVELAYAHQNNLPVGYVRNQTGKFVLADNDTVSLAAQGVTLPEDMRVKLVNSANPDAYPIAGFTWLLAYEKQTDAAVALALTRMLWWATHDGQSYSAGLDYAPLPGDAIRKAETLIKRIVVNGARALPASISP